MTRDQWLDKLVEMEFTTPPADTDFKQGAVATDVAPDKGDTPFFVKGGPGA